MSTENGSSEQTRLPREVMPFELTEEELGALIEAILLVSPEPPTIDEIATGTELDVEDIEAGLEWLEDQNNRGWVVQRHGRVRGVDSSGLLAKLHARGLIEPVSRLATVGNPIQYGTTADFLNHFGLQSLDDLPPLGTVDGQDAAQLLASAQAEPASEEDKVADKEDDTAAG